ncbi:hypothetical protein QEZ54_33465 [Catellatospora sp. KI3]|uniref:hypothetical protein n=1 Tax=Catellatospora sp. KI3 TaxID=3041620 RepID=UPI0024824C35|nr:hypothetical protein [Catellatospora sp. KI3]MDI1465894.1 hypothetical protein [Catellatospora sp. KI3]
MRTRWMVTGMAAVAALAMSACGPDGTGATGASPAAGASAGTGASPAGGGSGDRDSCLTGTWQVDVDDMAEQAAAMMAQLKAKGDGTGSITLTFGEKMTIKYDANIAIVVPMSAELTMKVDSKYTGSAVSSDWTSKGGKIAGTMPTNDVKMDMKATIAGKEAPMTQVPFKGALDLSQGALAYTCSGSTATLAGPSVTWHLKKA